jgi:pullulanase-type alpha-1,6-glucosidase
MAMFLPIAALIISLLPQAPGAMSSVSAVAPEQVQTVFLDQDTLTNDQRLVDPADAELVRESLVDPNQDEVFYFVLPDRFDDGDPNNNVGDDPGGTTTADVLRHGYLPTNRGFYLGGDIRGIIDRLPYLKAMGVTAIWMAPIFKNNPVQGDGTIPGSSAGYHGYWITDFTQIDPHFGTNDELKELIALAHDQDIKVFFDIITNHTADIIRYAENSVAYRNKKEHPYRDAAGNPFDDRDFINQPFPELDAETSFPYIPVFANPADATIKQPAWLNNPIYYHNRGNTDFVREDEDSIYGDFVGLDDLFTEHPDVVDGMKDIFKFWVSEFRIDGFRIDTVKHVNVEFWQEFIPAIEQYAQEELADPIPEFFMFAEAYIDRDIPYLSYFTTEGQFPAALDFPFQTTVRDYVSRGGASDSMRAFFEADDLYIDADGNAYKQPTFIGNHDMGRFGYFLTQDDPDATDAELLARTQLAHAIMFFARGMPVIYYGDEQGFVGDGNDKDARETMFGSQVASYLDNTYIGPDANPAQDKFDATHPIYQALQTYAEIYQAHEGLRQGAQIHRYSSDEAGIYAFSRIDRDDHIEYVVAFNNAAEAQSAIIDTFFPSTADFQQIYPLGNNTPVATNESGQLTVDVPATDFVIYRANSALPSRDSAPNISIVTPVGETEVYGTVYGDRLRVRANLAENVFAEVTFAVKVGDAAEYTHIGVDNNAPYSVYYPLTDIPVGSQLTFKAIVKDLRAPEGMNLASDMVTVTMAEVPPEPVPPCVAVDYAIIHYQRPAGDYGSVESGDYWGLHLWGEAIASEEVTAWGKPKPFFGETSFGRFAFIKLADPTKPLNFIVHTPNGDIVPGTREPGGDRSFIPAESPEIWLVQEDEKIYTSQAEAQGYVTVRYQRTDGDYGSVESGDYWGLHLWGGAIADGVATEWDAPRPADGVDDFGAYYNIPIKNTEEPVNFIIHTPSGDTVPDTREPGGDQSFDPSKISDVWMKQNNATVHPTRAAANNVALLHYHRPDGDYGDYTSSNFNDFWGLHVWDGAVSPTEWPAPLKPVGEDAFGVIFAVPLVEGATELRYIIHRGDNKDLPADQSLDLTKYGHEVWILQSTEAYVRPNAGSGCGVVDLNKASAFWETRSDVYWDIAADADNTYGLYYAPEGGMTVNEEFGLIEGGKMKPLVFQVGSAAPAHFKLADTSDGEIRDILKGQVIVAEKDSLGRIINATAVQTAGVLDDMYAAAATNETLGVSYVGNTPSIRVWAPTARSVQLQLFDTATTPTPSSVLQMGYNSVTGVWGATLPPTWNGKYYLFEVDVYVRSTGQVETNIVTDPYSFSLSMNSKRSQILNLDARALKPAGWGITPKPALDDFADVTLYELHVRDFSIKDATVPAAERGTFKAFTRFGSNGMRHLYQLAEAGLSHVHLLPSFDIATINEDKSQRQEPDQAALEAAAPDSETQQALVNAIRDKDGFNWGYDPYHYTVPEGSYSTNPQGPARIVEFRQMVQSLNILGLRVVMDVVYNHTHASGQSSLSVLDRIVPDYYHRLTPDGTIQAASCCPDTATEHKMMEKLMVDSLRVWATAYKVDGFRFDLMGFHTVDNMIAVRQMLDSLTIANSGVDGSKIFVYGEGWDFGGLSGNPALPNATQINLGNLDTSIATFNDRLRDAARGGSPVDGPSLRDQGFATGLVFADNGVTRGTPEEQQANLLLKQDQIRVGLTGNLRDYSFTGRTGATVTGADVPYGGSPAGYATDPRQAITYVAAHDNETLFDAIQLKAADADTLEQRVRMQNLATSLVALGQGVPFFHAGQELLRSKSMDRDSYNSGDWFNRLDLTYTSNNWGVGLPIAEKNEGNWPIMRQLLANPALKPDNAHILQSLNNFKEMLRIRKSSPLFRLGDAELIGRSLTFHNTGPDQLPGLVVMRIANPEGETIDPNYTQIVVLFNANDEAQTFTEAALIGSGLTLHPIQRESSDPIVRTTSFDDATGAFSIPARTTAVFVQSSVGQAPESQIYLPVVRLSNN